MKVETKIAGVLDRLRRRPRDVRAALELTLAPEAWKEALHREAQATLWALAKQTEWPQVPAFLNTMMVFGVGAGGPGFVARMTDPLPPALLLEDFAQARGIQKTGTGPTLFSDFLVQFDALLEEGVATEKRKDRRDWSKSDQEIAAVRRYSAALDQARNQKLRRQLWDQLLHDLARDPVRKRPHRREPRAVKRRPKPYPLLNQPRHKFVEISHRSRYWKGRPRNYRDLN